MMVEWLVLIGFQILAREEIFLDSDSISASSQLSCHEYADHTLLVGRSCGKGEGWPPTFIC